MAGAADGDPGKPDLIVALAAGFGAMAAGLAVQTWAAVAAPAIYAADRHLGVRQRFGRVLRLMLMLVSVAGAQMALWALVYLALGEFETAEAALYFSGVTFTTLGYGDVTLSSDARLLGPLEAAGGLLMFGVSTAIFAAAMQHWMRERKDG